MEENKTFYKIKKMYFFNIQINKGMAPIISTLSLPYRLKYDNNSMKTFLNSLVLRK